LIEVAITLIEVAIKVDGDDHQGRRRWLSTMKDIGVSLKDVVRNDNRSDHHRR